MKYFKIFFVILLFFLVLPLTKANIYVLEEPKNSYNVGDALNISFLIQSDIPYQGFVESDLYCSNSFKKNIFRTSVNLQQNTSKKLDVLYFLDVVGDCYVKISVMDEKENTDNFYVSDELKLNVFLNSLQFYPGEILKINGSVRKENSGQFDYSVLVDIFNISEKEYYFKEPAFSIEEPIKKNALAGNYTLLLKVQEEDIFGKILNSAIFSKNIEVLSKPTFLSIISNEVFKPPINYSAKIFLLDQSKEIIEGEGVLIKLISPEGDLILEEEILSGNNFSYFFPSNTTRGAWRLKVIYGSLHKEQLIQISENKQISFEVVNNPTRLIIKNVGNVLYEGVLDLSLFNSSNNSSSLINISLEVGESFEKSFSVQGVYNLTINNQTFYNIPITGAAVSKPDFFKNKRDLFVLIFLIFIFLFVLFILISNKKKIKKKQKEKIRGFYDREILSNSKDLDFKGRLNSGNSLDQKTKDKFNKKNSKKVYGLFFKENISEKLREILTKYGLKIYKFGDINLTLFTSDKKMADSLFKIAKLVHLNSSNKNIILHSASFEENIDMLKSFLRFREVFALDRKGIFVSEEILQELKDKKSFEKIGRFNNTFFWNWAEKEKS